jgi:hypothetical protein
MGDGADEPAWVATRTNDGADFRATTQYMVRLGRHNDSADGRELESRKMLLDHGRHLRVRVDNLQALQIRQLIKAPGQCKDDGIPGTSCQDKVCDANKVGTWVVGIIQRTQPYESCDITGRMQRGPVAAPIQYF